MSNHKDTAKKGKAVPPHLHSALSLLHSSYYQLIDNFNNLLHPQPFHSFLKKALKIGHVINRLIEDETDIETKLELIASNLPTGHKASKTS